MATRAGGETGTPRTRSGNPVRARAATCRGDTACALRNTGARDAVASVSAVAHSHPELVGKIVEVLGHDVERPFGFGLTGTRAALPGPPYVTGAQSELLGGR
jgi:hypothetical protein